VGRSAVSAIVVDGKKERVDAVLVDGPGRPAIELGVQAGASVFHDPERGYRASPGPEGTLAPGLYCAGSAWGPDAVAVGRAVRAALSPR
jgi:hypothetical protein